MAREFNALVTFDDAHYMLANEGYNQIESNMPTGTECMTKAAVLFFLDVVASNLDPLASDQLVPYQLLEPGLIGAGVDPFVQEVWEACDQDQETEFCQTGDVIWFEVTTSNDPEDFGFYIYIGNATSFDSNIATGSDNIVDLSEAKTEANFDFNQTTSNRFGRADDVTGLQNIFTRWKLGDQAYFGQADPQTQNLDSQNYKFI